jgi:hypothetical protein
MGEMARRGGKGNERDQLFACTCTARLRSELICGCI